MNTAIPESLLLLFLTVINPGCGHAQHVEKTLLEKIDRLFQQDASSYKAPLYELSSITKVKNLDSVIWVDIRSEKEQEISMIPDAIPARDFIPGSYTRSSRPLVSYCTIGARSGAFAEKMNKQGIPVQNLKGGILAWAAHGYQLVDSTGTTRRIHVYGKRWDAVPLNCESTW